MNSLQPSRRSRSTLLSPEVAAWIPRIAAISTAATKNVSASAAIAQPGLNTATSTPASAAPRIIVAFVPKRRTAFASRSRSSGTVSGTIDESAG